ncbi:MAG: glycosyltransferase [Solirubrobacteraceae bacterium]
MLVASAREAAGRGYKTTIWLSSIARDRPWLQELDGVAEVRWLEGAGGRVASTVSTLQALQAELAIQPGLAVLHTHFSTYDVPAAVLRLRRRRSAVFWHAHSKPLEGRGPRLRNRLRYAAFGPLVDGILCVSPEILEALRARGAPRGKLRDFPNAIDVRRFAPATPEQKRAARRSLEVPETARVVLHFGWDWHRKGGDLMFGAAELLSGEPDLVWLTVGGEGAQALPDPQDTHPVVRRLPPTNDVRELYAAADLFLSCSRAEGMPYAVLEALACGLPVVGTDLPVQCDLLAGLSGAAAVPGDPGALAQAVRAMLTLTESDRENHAEAARQRVTDSYSLDVWARRLVDLYAERLSPDA